VFTLANNLKPGLLQGAHGIQVVDARYAGHGYTCTSISRASAP
jgi:hypothetical protein